MKTPFVLFELLLFLSFFVIEIQAQINRKVLTNSIESQNFVVHYDLSGQYATTQEWADSTLSYAEQAYTEYKTLGWQLLAADYGMGGNDKYDIYIYRDGSLDGITYDEMSIEGSSYRKTSFIEIRRNASPLNITFNQLDYLKVIVVHEIHHAIQYTYNANVVSDEVYFAENTSVLMERLLVNETNVLSARMHNYSGYYPVTSLNQPHANIKTSDGSYEYSSLWPIFLHEYYGNNIIRKIWERTALLENAQIFDIINEILIQDYSSNLSSALHLYSIWRFFTGNRDIGQHFSEANSWPESEILHAHTQNAQYTNTAPIGFGGTFFVQFLQGQNHIMEFYFEGDVIQSSWSSYVNVVNNNNYLVYPLEMSDGTGSLDIAWENENYMVLSGINTKKSEPDDITNDNFWYDGKYFDFIDVVFWNKKLSNGVNLGDTLIIDNSIIKQSSEIHYFKDLDQHLVKTNKERFTDPEILKHNQWNDNQSHLLSEQFLPNYGLQKTALFDELTPVSVANDFTAAAYDGEMLEFHDPWYVDANGQQPDTFLPFDSPHQPTGSYNETSGGVFLDQPFTGNNPHYSVKAAATQTVSFHGEDVLWYFQRWEGTDVDFEDAANTQTAVVFKENGAQARAVYKGHLASDKTTPSGLNNGRRIVRENATELHMFMPTAMNFGTPIPRITAQPGIRNRPFP